jgi:DNA-directed RNA polymerase specialized sigma24 family protein
VRRLRTASANVEAARLDRRSVVFEARDAGLSLAEIAAAVGMTRSGVKKLLLRAAPEAVVE